MRLLHDNKIDGATLTPSSENANYPAANLKDTRLSRKWRTTGDEDESLLIDADGEVLGVFQATDNLADPDLMGGGWTPNNVTRVLSGETYESFTFVKITLTAANGYLSDVISFTASGDRAVQKLLRKGDDTQTKLILQDTTAPATRLEMLITWGTKTITETVGTDHMSIWFDDETVLLLCIASGVVHTNTNELRVQGVTNGKYFYAIAPQCEDLPYPTPYINGSRAVTHPDETFEMPSKFTIDMIVRPWFAYDLGVSLAFLSWYIGGTYRFRLGYRQDLKKIYTYWIDGGTARSLFSQEFDDGTSEVDLNQRIRVIASIDLTTGDTTGSRLIVEPLESGAIAEDTSWNGNIDALNSTFSTLSIGHENDIVQADSQIEYIRIYKGTLVGAVGNSVDADALLAEKELILDKTYLEKITASYALIAGHNISAGASIKLQGNDYNSWNGPPLEEDMTWDSKTIVHAFTEVSYPFWQLLIDDPNNADGIIKIGRPYLGTHYQVEKTFNKEFTEETFNTDIASYSQSGQLYTRRGYDGKQYNLNFPYWENSVKQAIEDIMATVGKRNPLFLILDEDNIDVLPVLYCHIPNDPQYPHIVDYRWKGSLSFREVF